MKGRVGTWMDARMVSRHMGRGCIDRLIDACMNRLMHG